MKRLLYFILPIVTLILEMSPHGAVCIFAPSPTERIRETFSYFDLLPFGYANFAPFLTAITTCAILTLLLIDLFTNKQRLITVTKFLLCIATGLSVCPLLYGTSYVSIVGILITLSLFSEFLLLQFTSPKTVK